MAYVSQDDKAKLAVGVKAVLKKYGMSGTISVRHHSTLVVTIKSGKLDMISNYNKVAKANYRGHFDFHEAEGSIDVNTHWFHQHFDGECKKFLEELINAMKGADYFDDSDSQTDYFACSHYYDVRVGKWDKAYQVV